MNDKRKQIEVFVSEYNTLEEQGRLLRQLQDRLHGGEEVGYEGVIHIGGDVFSLASLSGFGNEKLFETFEEELKLFVAFLLSGNEAKLERLLTSVSVIQEASESEVGIKSPPTGEVSTLERVRSFLLDHEKGTVLNPSTVFDILHEEIQGITLSEVHQVCRRLVEDGEMAVVHQASCHKCSTGFFKVYESLPKSVTCGDCGNDIVNIEIQYRLL